MLVARAASRRWTMSLVVALSLLLSFISARPAVAGGQSVEDFMKLKSKWNDLVGSRFYLEGRVNGQTENVFGLVGCPLEFRVKDKLPKFEGRKEVVEVNAELARDERTNAIYLKVESFKRLDSDEKQFQKRKGQLTYDSADGWYELAEWAIARGDHYKDQELIRLGRSCQTQGFAIERRDKRNRTPEGLERLADRAMQLTGDESVRYSILHEALQLQWRTVREKPRGDDVLGFAQSLSKKLPFGTERIAADDEVLKAQFAADALKAYEENEASATGPDDKRNTRRLKLHRLFYADVIQVGLTKLAKPNGSNGKEMAGLALHYLPEFPALAAEFTRRDLEYRLEIVSKATWGELTLLRKELTEADRAADARTAFDKWFRATEESLKKRGFDGLIELAGLYEQLPELEARRRTAKDLLLQADKLSPGSGQVAERLAKYGLENVAGVWMSKEQAEAERNTPIAVAMREGRVIAGMSAEQVRRTLGQPSTVTRFATNRLIKEYWVYPDSRFTVRLERATQRTDLLVIGIVDLPQ